jgi:hypothetical protein
VHEKQTLFVDCDNTFSAKRLSQLASGKFDEIAELVFLVKKDFRSKQHRGMAGYTAKNFGWWF